MSKKKQTKIINKSKVVDIKKIDFFEKYKFVILTFVLLLTFVLFYKVIYFDFLSNWDDFDLVAKNYFVTNFSTDGFNTFLNYKILNHDPITLLSHAITYKYWALNPLPYHLINLVLHLTNICLVFFLIIKIEKNYFFAFIVTVLFAIHPFRVESVAWIAERKDVLYSFFFLISLICYLNYLKGIKQKLNLTLAFFTFIFSLLCKFSAITLPAIIVIIDWYMGRKINIKLIIEKAIFFIPSIIMIALHFSFDQNMVGNNFIYVSYNYLDRLFFPPYALFYYIYNVVFPYKLAVVHQYPEKINNLLPVMYYISMPIIIVLFTTIIYVHKKFIKIPKLIWFGILFFLINISIVLHFVPFGGNIVVGERYTYMAYLGLFIIIAYGLSELKNSKNTKLKVVKNLVYFVSISFLIIFSSLTYSRTKVWKNGVTLFEDAVSKFPKSDYSHFALGCAYNDAKDYKKALQSFDQALQLKPYYLDALNNRARARFELGDHNGALDDCNKLIATDSTYAFAYYNKANTLAVYQKYAEAELNLDKAIKFDTNFSEAYNNRGNTKAIKGDYDAAKKDFTKALSLNPNLVDAYVNLGLVYFHEKNKTEYCKLWSKGIDLGSEKAKTLFEKNCN